MKIFNLDVSRLYSWAKENDALIANHLECLVPKIMQHLEETVCYVLGVLDPAQDTEERKKWSADRDELLEYLRFYYNKSLELGYSTEAFKGIDVYDFTDEPTAIVKWGELAKTYGIDNCNAQTVPVTAGTDIIRISVLTFGARV